MDEFCRDLKKFVPHADCAFYGIDGAKKVFGPAYEEALSQCRIGLNISRRNDSYLYSSDRIAHMIGNGLAVCIDRASGYGDLFSEDEMIFYSSEEELFSKINLLKKDDEKRKQIARSGWMKYSSLFNSTKIAQYMIDVVFGAHNPTKYNWPTTA